MEKVIFIVEKTGPGFSAYAKDFENIPAGTTGNTMRELKRDIEDSYNSLAELKGWAELGIDDITLNILNIKLSII